MNVYRLALEFKSMLMLMEALTYGAQMDYRSKNAVYDTELNSHLVSKSTLSIKSGRQYLVTIGISNRTHISAKSGPIVGYMRDQREIERDIFAIYPQIIKIYLPFASSNTMEMTGDNLYHAIRRVLFSFAWHEIRHQAQFRNNVSRRSLDDAFNLSEFNFGGTSEYMRMIVGTRSLLIRYIYANQKNISMEDRLQMEEDAFVAEAIGFCFYPLWRDGKTKELVGKIQKYLLQ